MLQHEKPKIRDAIGYYGSRCTKLAHIQGYDIEHCIDWDNKEITARTGKIINGKFVKDK